MHRKKLMIFSFLISILLIFTSCGSSGNHDNMATKENANISESYEESYDSAAKDTIDSEDNIDPSEVEPITDKIITNIYLDIETTDFKSFINNLEELLTKNNGYIENSNIYHNDYSRTYKSGNFVIRIPKDKADEFKIAIAEKGHLTSESTNKQDVSSHYRDTESRLKIIETKEQRILKLLDSATTMSDIIELEKELNNTIYEKESLTSSLLNLDDSIDYSTVHINIMEVERYSNVENKDTGLSTRISNAFKDSLHFFTGSLEDILIFMIYAMPFLIIFIILIFIIRKLLKKYNKNNKPPA